MSQSSHCLYAQCLEIDKGSDQNLDLYLLRLAAHACLKCDCANIVTLAEFA